MPEIIVQLQFPIAHSALMGHKLKLKILCMPFVIINWEKKEIWYIFLKETLAQCSKSCNSVGESVFAPSSLISKLDYEI